VRVILDTNIWSYIAASGEADPFDEFARERSLDVVVPPSILLEALRTSDPAVRAQIVNAITGRDASRSHPSTEARQMADEVVSEIRRLRPKWLRTFPETSKLPVLENFWTKKIWQEAAADPSLVADRMKAVPEMDQAGEHVYATQQFNKEAFIESDASANWEVEPSVDLSVDPNNELETYRRGWDGERVAFWRVDSAMTWRDVALRGGRSPLHKTLHDWLAPWVRSDLLRRERESWNRFWYYEIDGAMMPRNWITSLMPWAQILTKLGEGNPRDIQHAAYLYDADIFFTADRRYAASLEHLRPWSPVPFARTTRLSATAPIVAGIKDEVDRVESQPS
jgi:hypothetical protein